MTRLSEVTDWAGVQKQAQAFLSAPQLAALKALSDQKQLDQEMTKLAVPSWICDSGLKQPSKI